MNEAALAVAAAVDAIFSATQKSCHDEKQLSAIGSAATAVTAAIDSVMNKLREGPQTTGSGEGKSSTQHEDLIDSVMDSIEQLFSSLGRPADMVKQVKHIIHPYLHVYPVSNIHVHMSWVESLSLSVAMMPLGTLCLQKTLAVTCGYRQSAQ